MTGGGGIGRKRPRARSIDEEDRGTARELVKRLSGRAIGSYAGRYVCRRKEDRRSPVMG